MAVAQMKHGNGSRCFEEDDATASLARKSLAEGLGTMLLMIAVAGSTMTGIPSSLGEAVAIGGSLIGLILAFGTASGGHFNPTITIMQWVGGRRRLDCTLAYVGAQTVGGLAGSMISAFIFATPIGRPTSGIPSISNLGSEGVASFALMTIVFCCTRSANKFVGPFAVGLWLMAAIVSTPTGSIANPAVAVALLATPASASLYAVMAFVAVELLGGGLASWIVSYVYPEAARPDEVSQFVR